MTEKEFAGWTWHTAENVVGQRDDALARLAQADAADAANAAAADAKLTEATNQIALLTQQLADLTQQLAEWEEKCRTMEGHPDVIAARKEAALVKAKADKAQALELLAAAEKALGE